MSWVTRAREITWGTRRGGPVLVIGGGPSVLDAPRDLLARAPAVCCNDAYRLRRGRSLVVAMDRRWAAWHRDRLTTEGHVVLTQAAPAPVEDFYHFRRERDAALSRTPDRLSGLDTGYAAVNAAFLIGATEVVLVGYDMAFSQDGRSHWHEGHVVPTAEGQYLSRFLPQYKRLVDALESEGVRVSHLPGCAAIGGRVEPEDATKIVEGW